ncbi:MAG: TRAP transporter substrate-binding protein DctP [Spirochaetaceae bacterium]|jgi:TRAP-type C4-dicarboxylate transport system substrate-binding protein|nr:TRAP transporter substrate-binding protein DctP [Spirochaetaceae bacterium]
MKYQKKCRVLIWVVLFFSVIQAAPLYAQRKITIKLASLVPENTPWGAAINRMSVEWAKATNGEVELVVYHNGVAGSEGDVLRKLNLNQIQAAVFTSIGLNSVTPEIMTVSYPLLIRNDAELEAVLRKLRPELDARIEKNGFTTLAWARAGWVKIFSKAPVFTPAELRRQKLGTNPDELEMLQAFKAMGFQMVPVNMNDVLVSLNGGMIDAIYQSPISVAGYQLFGVAKNMSTINLAPFMGGIIMNRTAWRRIPDRYKDRLMAICKQIETEIDGSIAKLEAEAVATMTRYGLTINQLSPAQEQEWYRDMAQHENELVGPIFNKEIYQKITDILQEYRKGQ